MGHSWTGKIPSAREIVPEWSDGCDCSVWLWQCVINWIGEEVDGIHWREWRLACRSGVGGQQVRPYRPIGSTGHLDTYWCLFVETPSFQLGAPC